MTSGKTKKGMKMAEKLEDGLYVYKGSPDVIDGFKFKPGKMYCLHVMPGLHTVKKRRFDTAFNRFLTYVGLPRYDTYTMMTLVRVNDLATGEGVVVPYASPTFPQLFWEKAGSHEQH